MSDLIKFEFEGHALRTAGTANAPEFHANDLCALLVYANARDAVARHVAEDDVVKRDVIDSMGRTQSANFVTEPGMYALVMGANTEAAKRVQRWVTHEVLPALRKTGRYETTKGVSNGDSLGVRELNAKRLESRERRLNAEFILKTLRTINKATPLDPSVFSATAAAAMETVAGKALPGLKPATSLDWFTPTQIAIRLGCTVARVGLTITALGIRGNHEGIARAVLDKAAHSDKTVTTYQYTERAIAMIAAKLTETASASELPS